MSVKFSHEMSCWTYLCAWGCFGWDYEGQQEAEDAFLGHECDGMKA